MEQILSQLQNNQNIREIFIPYLCPQPEQETDEDNEALEWDDVGLLSNSTNTNNDLSGEDLLTPPTPSDEVPSLTTTNPTLTIDNLTHSNISDDTAPRINSASSGATGNTILPPLETDEDEDEDEDENANPYRSTTIRLPKPERRSYLTHLIKFFSK